MPTAHLWADVAFLILKAVNLKYKRDYEICCETVGDQSFTCCWEVPAQTSIKAPLFVTAFILLLPFDFGLVV